MGAKSCCWSNRDKVFEEALSSDAKHCPSFIRVSDTCLKISSLYNIEMRILSFIPACLIPLSSFGRVITESAHALVLLSERILCILLISNAYSSFFIWRWKIDGKGDKVLKNGKPVLEFVAIQRRDTNEWAIPGVSWRLSFCDSPLINMLLSNSS